MDDRRFDDLTRRLARGTSRRQVLKTLASGALGGFAGALGLGQAGAAGCNADAECARGETCDPATGRCMRRGGGGNGRPANQTQSQSVGVAAVCAVDADCAPGEACVDSVCTPRGGGGQCVRGSGCISDATCCGGEVCDTSAGVCVGAGGPCTNTDGTCTDSLDCCGNEDCVGNLCQRTAGGCAPGAACAGDAECCGGQVCASGTCAQAARPAGCPAGTFRCSGNCVDISIDPNNCGACGVVCAEGVACVNGTCSVTGECQEGLTNCSGACISLRLDPNNCGACGKICESGICNYGTCSSTEMCADGRYVCPDAYRGGDICCDACSECRRSGEGEFYCASDCTGPTGRESACAPCNDGICGEDPCDYTSEYCDFATGECLPFQQRVCPDGSVCPPDHVCGSNQEGTQTVCCPVDESGSANICGVGFEDGTVAVGCQCTTEFGQQGCEIDGVCCQSFSAPGVCYCAPTGFGCSTENPACADPDNCSYCCSGVCIIAEGYTDQGMCA